MQYLENYRSYTKVPLKITLRAHENLQKKNPKASPQPALLIPKNAMVTFFLNDGKAVWGW